MGLTKIIFSAFVSKVDGHSIFGPSFSDLSVLTGIGIDERATE